MTEQITVICPKHGEHEHAITSNIPGHEGAWCQICWLESLGPSLPYRKELVSDDEIDSYTVNSSPNALKELRERGLEYDRQEIRSAKKQGR